MKEDSHKLTQLSCSINQQIIIAQWDMTVKTSLEYSLSLILVQQQRPENEQG